MQDAGRDRLQARPAALAPEQTQRASEIAREVAIGGLAGLVAGLLAVGVGGRVFMRVAALIDPSAVGLITDNGNRIGDVTLVGTVAFVVFVGIAFGVEAAIVWVAVAPWIPGQGIWRSLLTGVVAVALGSYFVIRIEEPDFQLLEQRAVAVAMLVLVIAAYGIVVSLTDAYLRRRAPKVDAPRSGAIAGYLALCLVGLLIAPVAIGAYFVSERGRPPTEVGVALVIVGLATVASWVLRVRDGRAQPPHPPRWLLVAGRGALVLAVLLGALRLANESVGIVSGLAP